eukprot:TRINITY_DN11728_c0_g1_i1.p1 TRINITY_DN11728_c0_g1~~TRINITY_DN11728_c0_g1_i1.p1  ORF type:complete len:320 (+),score=45.29 TRINITY_DN11728_c0_g1_i1:25-984(+)
MSDDDRSSIRSSRSSRSYTFLEREITLSLSSSDDELSDSFTNAHTTLCQSTPMIQIPYKNQNGAFSDSETPNDNYQPRKKKKKPVKKLRRLSGRKKFLFYQSKSRKRSKSVGPPIKDTAQENPLHFSTFVSSGAKPHTQREEKMKRILGSELDFKRDAYVVCQEQPSHVRSYKVHKLLGQRVPFAKGRRVPGFPDPDFQRMQRHRRVQKFFGENFDVEAVQYVEKLNIVDEPKLERRKSKLPQPEHVQVSKLDHFFGCKTNIQLIPNIDQELSYVSTEDDYQNPISGLCLVDDYINVKVDQPVPVLFIQTEPLLESSFL